MKGVESVDGIQKKYFDGKEITLILFLGCLVLLGLSGCTNENGSSSKASPSVAAAKPAEANRIFAAKAVGQPEPNKYVAALRWNYPFRDSFSIERRQEKTATELAHLPAGASEFNDADVVPGATYKYYLVVSENNEPKSVASTGITIPKDLSVVGRQALISVSRVNRLFLDSNSILFTDGLDASIDVGEILSNEGTVESFSQGQRTTINAAGRSGGAIRIVAQKATGRLHVFARGESGGDGIDGANGVNGSAGTKGQPGDWGMNSEIYKYLIEKFAKSFGDSLRRYPKPYTDSEWSRAVGGIPFYICARAPSNGTPGGNGSPAGDGSPGGNGGNSGRVVVIVNQDTDFVVDVRSEIGSPGIGGRGGKGGEGGLGGPPGDLDQGHKCPAAGNGPNGLPGLNGRQGIPGQPGSLEPVCVKLGNHITGDCSKAGLPQ